jgi:hypothetical protein
MSFWPKEEPTPGCGIAAIVLVVVIAIGVYVFCGGLA